MTFSQQINIKTCKFFKCIFLSPKCGYAPFHILLTCSESFFYQLLLLFINYYQFLYHFYQLLSPSTKFYQHFITFHHLSSIFCKHFISIINFMLLIMLLLKKFVDKVPIISLILSNTLSRI